MTLGNKIAFYRKNLNITQDALARQLGVTNQAVSKWESGQCCPDVMLLPKIAEIFGVSIDALFDRETEKKKECCDQMFDFPEKVMLEVDNIMHDIISEDISDNAVDELDDQVSQETKKTGFEKMFGISLTELDKKGNQRKRAEQPPMEDFPWEDDNVLRVAVYVGRNLVCGGLAKPGYEFNVKRDVDGVLNSISGITVICRNVAGDVDAGGDVTCMIVGGDVDAGGNVSCDAVGGDVDAGASVSCGAVGGDVDAGSSVACGDVGGDVDAGTDVRCGNVYGDIDAGCCVECASVKGDIDAGGTVTIHK